MREGVPSLLREHLAQQQEDIEFVHGAKYESAEQHRWKGYEVSLGKIRNSYSATDPDATFMRMKDDRM